MSALPRPLRWLQYGRCAPPGSTSSRKNNDQTAAPTSYQRISAAVEVLAVGQVGAAGQHQQQASVLPAARQQLCCVQAGHLHKEIRCNKKAPFKTIAFHPGTAGMTWPASSSAVSRLATCRKS